MKKIFIVAIIPLSLIFSQNSFDVLRPFWGFDNSQILSNSIGGATVASGYVTPGLSSNPANLAAIQFPYLQLNFSNSEFNSSSSNISKTGFNGLDFVQPLPVYQGRLVISAGAHKSVDYMSVYQGDFYNSSEKGNLTSYHLAAAVEFSKNLYLGADLKFLSGKSDMIEFGENETHHYNPEYSGSGLTLGLLHRLTKNLQYGISLDMPSSINVNDQYTFSDHLDSEQSFSDVWEYTAKKPVTIHAGGAILLNLVNFFYEVEYTDWRNLEFLSENIYEEDLELQASVNINNEIRHTFNPTISHHFGTAMRVPLIPAHIFAGYQYLPVPFNDDYDNNVRECYSLGFSLKIKDNITLQGSYDNFMWQYMGTPENFDKFSIGISLHDIPGF